jgi:hypothetical protein
VERGCQGPQQAEEQAEDQPRPASDRTERTFSVQDRHAMDSIRPSGQHRASARRAGWGDARFQTASSWH